MVLGALYRSDVDPPQHKEKQVVLLLPAGSAQPKFKCEIAGDPPSLKLTLPDGVAVEVTKGKVHLKADTATATLDARGQIDVKVGDASMTLKKDGTMQMRCKDFKLQASGNIDLKASGSVKVKGASVELN